MASLPGADLNLTANALLASFTRGTGYDDYTVLALSVLGLTGYLTNGKIWNKPDPNRYKWFERPQESMIADAQSKETRNIAQKLEETNKELVIFWGSQSGTAEGFAHRLARECHRRFKLEALVADLSDYDAETIALVPSTKLAIFIMSTYGEGDPSDNASEFWDWMHSKSTSLSNLRYAAFGLGNTNYKYYNKVIDVVVEKLEVSQAKLLLPVGKADDATNNTEEDFLEWKEQLFQLLQRDLGYIEHERGYEATLEVVEDTSLDVIDCYLGEPYEQMSNKKGNSQTSTVSALGVKNAYWLASNSHDNRQCLHVELDISEHNRLKYKTGDHLAMLPTNPNEEITRLLNMLGLETKKDIPLLITSLDQSNKKTRMPSPTTLSALFSSYFEICAPVSREAARSLIPFARSETIREFLLNLTNDKDSYAIFLSKTHITLARLLEYAVQLENDQQGLLEKESNDKRDGDFNGSNSWPHLPLSFILETLKPMTPRYYSISSSAVISPQQLSITVAHSPTVLSANPDVNVPGLASSHLASTYLRSSTTSGLPTATTAIENASIDQYSQEEQIPQPKLYASIIRSTFKLPTSPTTPLILIGTGTGIAPFRAFLHERAALADMGRPTGQILFFYGCRDEETDFLYRDEIQSLLLNSKSHASVDTNNNPTPILTVVTAFSRPNTLSLSSSSSFPSPTNMNRTRTQKQIENSGKGTQGEYVQDKIQHATHAATIVRLLLDEDAAIYFCGSTRMARDAGRAVMRVVGSSRGWIRSSFSSSSSPSNSAGADTGADTDAGADAGAAPGVTNTNIQPPKDPKPEQDLSEECLRWRDERRRCGRWKEDVWG